MECIVKKWIAAAVLAAFALPLAAAEYVKNGDFENGKTAPWFFLKANPNASLSVVTDAAPPEGGSGVLGITFSKDRRVDFRQNLNVGPGKYKFSAYLDTTRCAPQGQVILDLVGRVGGKWHTFAHFSTPSNDSNAKKITLWRRYETVVTVPPDGVIKALVFRIVNINGTVMADRISLRDYDENEQKKDQQKKVDSAAREAAENRAPRAVFRTLKYQNLFRAEEIPERVFELFNPEEREISLPVRFVTSDYFGREVMRREKVFTLPAKGKISEVLRYPECRLPGFYCTTATWKTGKVSGKIQSSFVKVAPIPAKKDPLFGITHFFHYNGKDAELMESLAVGSKGILFAWNWYYADFRNNKPEKFEQIRQGLEDLKRCGIEPIGAFQMYYGQWRRDSWKRWMPKGKVKGEDPTAEELKEVLVPYIEKVVTLCKPYVKTWYLGGELDIGYQNYAAAYPNYVGMMKFAAETIRRVDPEATVQGIGCGGMKSHPQYPMIAKVLPEVKEYLDGISPDLYPGGNRYGKGFVTLNSEENNFRPSMLKLVEMAKVTRKGFVSCAEGGAAIYFDTPLDDPCGGRMANIHARQFILLKTVPKFRHWLYYAVMNPKGKTGYGWGMWEKEDPRQIVSSYAATARIMAFAEFVKELPLHLDLPCWIFKKDGRYFAALWYNGKDPLKIELPAGIGAEAMDVQGNPIDLAARRLVLGDAPVYLYAESPEALGRLLANAAAGVAELEFSTDRKLAGTTLLAIKNKSGHKIDLTLTSAELSGSGIAGKKVVELGDRLSLAPGEIRTVEKPIGAESVVFRVETAEGIKYAAEGVLKSVPVPRVSGFDELENKAIPQLLRDPARQIPGYDDLTIHGTYTGLEDLSGEFRLGYDNRNLYLEVRVKDDVHRNDNAPGYLYGGDCIQFAIDANRDAKMKLARGIRGYSDDDFNFVSGLVKGKPYSWCFVAPTAKRAELLEKPYRLTPEIIRNEAAKTTIYRVKLAFDDLAPLKPEPGRNFGFSLIVFDRDTPTSFYHMDYSEGVCNPFDPSKYPAFQFE